MPTPQKWQTIYSSWAGRWSLIRSRRWTFSFPRPWATPGGDYAAMQAEQGLPFADFTGQPIRRYTFRITNYPGMDGGVQANLYLCGDTLIGGDVVATGKGGFQHGLAYPAV